MTEGESYKIKLSPEWTMGLASRIESGRPFTEFLDCYRKIMWAVEQLDLADRTFETETFGQYLILFKIHGTVQQRPLGTLP